MIRPSKAVIAGAAVAGLLTGSVAVRAYAVTTLSNPGVSLQTMADAEKGKHACKGQNDCNGHGGRKTIDAACKAKELLQVRETFAFVDESEAIYPERGLFRYVW